MQSISFKENDNVYTSFGYGKLINTGRKQNIQITIMKRTVPQPEISRAMANSLGNQQLQQSTSNQIKEIINPENQDNKIDNQGAPKVAENVDKAPQEQTQIIKPASENSNPVQASLQPPQALLLPPSDNSAAVVVNSEIKQQEEIQINSAVVQAVVQEKKEEIQNTQVISNNNNNNNNSININNNNIEQPQQQNNPPIIKEQIIPAVVSNPPASGQPIQKEEEKKEEKVVENDSNKEKKDDKPLPPVANEVVAPVVQAPPPLVLSSTDPENVNIITVQTTFNTLVYIPDTDLRRTIIVKVKTFFGQRKTFSFEVDINSQVPELKNRVIQAAGQNIKNFKQIRLLYPTGVLKDVGDNGSFWDFKIMDGAQLIMVAQLSIVWDPLMKAPNIKLSNNNLVASKPAGDDFQCILGNIAMSAGCHYWEIRIDKCSTEEEDLYIGISRQQINLEAQPSSTGIFWGYICLCKRKVGPDGSFLDYGDICQIGDVIGVQLEFKGGIGTLSFYRNNIRLGEAFNNLSGTFYPSVGMFMGDIQVSLDPNATNPIN